ncbi:hypothetical protein VVD49_08425 [Uliginosibacterium sp. H3]|uniref:PEGA domain-containing protein n=1 Tax=Uliginosibacterium silvisoli TaxID=3114758 RepID=A0ABU6K2I4_9RHOO|nr:hypothetical protein [Uliginosibacterium sp. H3]
MLVLGAVCAPVVVPMANAQTKSVAESAALRVLCDGEAKDAEVFVDAQFKGECPVDITLAAGSHAIRVVKKIGDTRERVFEQTVRVAGGTAKRIEVALGPETLTAGGERIEATRRQQAAVEAERQAQVRRRAAEEQARVDNAAYTQSVAAQRQRVDPVVDGLLAELRARGAAPTADCPDCPRGVRPGARVDTDVPPAPDAGMAEWLQKARTEVVSYVGEEGASFRPPSQAIAMPCEGAFEAMRKLAGLTDMGDMSASDRKAMLAQPGMSADYLSYLRDIRIWPVQATCSQGVLNGPLELWGFGNSVWSSQGMVNVGPRLVHVRGTVVGGKPAGPWYVATRTGSSLTRYADASTDAMMRKGMQGDPSESFMVIYSEGDQMQSRSASISVALFANSDVQKYSGGLKASFTRPTSANTAESLGYDGLRLASRTLMKDGKLHGPMTIYGYTRPGGFLLPDTKYPTSVTCFRDGKAVQLDPCRMD